MGLVLVVLALGLGLAPPKARPTASTSGRVAMQSSRSTGTILTRYHSSNKNANVSGSSGGTSCDRSWTEHTS